MSCLVQKQAGLSLNSRISGDIEELIRNQKLKKSGIAQSDLDQLKTSVDIETKKIAETGKENQVALEQVRLLRL